MRFTGDDGRDLDWAGIEGFVISNALVEGLDLKGAPGRAECLVGETKETLFIDDSNEGVKGVFASERARVREGVLGWPYISTISQILRTSQEGTRNK